MPLAVALGMSILIVIYFFSWVQFYSSLDATDTKLNVDNLTPSDYTVMVKGGPIGKISDEEFLEEFKTHVRATLREVTEVPVDIAKAVFTYDITPFTEKIEWLRQLKRKKAAIDQYRTAYEIRGKKLNVPVTQEELKNLYPETRNFHDVTCRLVKNEDYGSLSKQIDELDKALDEYHKLDVAQMQKLSIVFITFTRTCKSFALDHN